MSTSPDKSSPTDDASQSILDSLTWPEEPVDKIASARASDDARSNPWPQSDTAIADPPPPARPMAHKALLIGSWALLLILSVALIWAGLWIRRWTWDNTQTIHFSYDMQNALDWGSRAEDAGYLDLYQKTVARHHDGNYGLDYSPLRLAMVNLWVHHLKSTGQYQPRWQDDYSFNKPLLVANATVEFAAALAAFLIVRACLRRFPPNHADDEELLHPLCLQYRPLPLSQSISANWLGLLAAALVWLSPAMIISSHGRPTWDVWVVSFYLWAVYAAFGNRWFVSGLILGIGCMFKGQLFIIAPLFIFWPLFQWQIKSILHWAVGLLLAIALILSPWMITWQPAGMDRQLDLPAVAWVLAISILVLAVSVFRNRIFAGKWTGRLAAGFIVLAVALSPLLGQSNAWPWLLPVGLALAIASTSLAARHALLLLSITLAGALFSCIWLFHGQTDWYEIALVYGAKKFTGLTGGNPSSLASILNNVYRLDGQDIVFTLPAQFMITWPTTPLPITIQQAMSTVVFLGMLLSGWALARHQRQQDRKILLAWAAPWILFFAFGPKMHERYLLWGAIAGLLAIGISPGMTLLALLLCGIQWIMSMDQIVMDSGRHSSILGIALKPETDILVRDCFRAFFPHMGWAVMTVALIFLYAAIRSSPRHAARSKMKSPGPVPEFQSDAGPMLQAR